MTEGQQKNETERPDHGPTQVHTIEELRVGNLYIHHVPINVDVTNMNMIQLLSLPAQSGINTGIYPGLTFTIRIKTFYGSDINKSSTTRSLSLPEIGLARYPGSPGEYDPNRWLEDPLKMAGGHPNMTQEEALKIIKKRMNQKKRWNPFS